MNQIDLIMRKLNCYFINIHRFKHTNLVLLVAIATSYLIRYFYLKSLKKYIIFKNFFFVVLLHIVCRRQKSHILICSSILTDGYQICLN